MEEEEQEKEKEEEQVHLPQLLLLMLLRGGRTYPGRATEKAVCMRSKLQL